MTSDGPGRERPGGVIISPSILAADQVHLARDLEPVLAPAIGADALHIDVMDGAFVANQYGGPALVAAVRRFTDADLDCHLMIEHPARSVTSYVEAGATSVTVHLEALTDPAQTAGAIRTAGARAGLALRPTTPVADIARLISEFDFILVMTVEPGRGGQPFLMSSLPRIAQARELVDRAGSSGRLQVDGGITAATIGLAAAAGADMFVAGEAVFQAADPAAEVASLRGIARSARR